MDLFALLARSSEARRAGKAAAASGAQAGPQGDTPRPFQFGRSVGATHSRHLIIRVVEERFLPVWNL